MDVAIFEGLMNISVCCHIISHHITIYNAMWHAGVLPGWGWGGGGTPYNGLYGEAPPERGTFKRVGISQVDVYNRVEKSVIYVFIRAFNQNISNRRTYGNA